MTPPCSKKKRKTIARRARAIFKLQQPRLTFPGGGPKNPGLLRYSCADISSQRCKKWQEKRVPTILTDTPVPVLRLYVRKTRKNRFGTISAMGQTVIKRI